MLLKLRSLPAFEIGSVVILIIALMVRLPGYNFSLPYVERIEEPNFYLAGLEARGLFDNGNYYDGYPPVYIAIQASAQNLLEPLGIRGLAPTVQVMRLVSILANIVTLLLVMLTARLAAGDLAGWLAGASFAISTLIAENSVYAIPDVLVYLFVALSLWLAASAVVDPKRQGMCVWGMVAAIIAVMLKYPVLPVIGVPGLAALAILMRERRWRYLAMQAGLLLGTALWFFFIYTANIQPEGSEYETVSQSGFANFLNPVRILNNLYYTILPLQPLVFVIVISLGIAAFAICWRQGKLRVQTDVVFLSLLLLITIPWVAASFSQAGPQRMRDVLPATLAACVLLGIALAQIYTLFPRRWGKPGILVIILPMTYWFFAPQFNADLSLIRQRHLPDTRVALREWFDINLEPGTVLVDDENHKTFNPIWGGIPYRHWVDWIVTDNLMQHSPAEWREAQGISYMQISRFQIEAMNRTEEGRAYLAQLLHLRDFFAPPPTRGPEMAFYRLWRMEHETHIQFGDHILLTGYDQNTVEVEPGENLTFRFYWQPRGTPDDNYSLFIHLVPIRAYEIVAQADGAPAVPERPTLTWNEPSETLISLLFNLAIPPDLSPGKYRIMVGLYNYITLERLPLKDGSDAWMLGEITVSD
jgi:hypothetical protein